VTASEQEVLVARLGQYPVGRYPVQHATTQFHLGSVLLHAGDARAALDALVTSRTIFAVAGMRLEQAKATVQLGVALRIEGRLHEATAAFISAASDFGDLQQPAEQAAASYNLGLAHQDAGQHEAAHAAWAAAHDLFLVAQYPGRAAVAARDHGASLLQAGHIAAALPLLEEAVALADRAADEPVVGAAANALGLARLAQGEPSSAVTALQRALAGFPRMTRPTEYAMVKANLGLAHEQSGDPARARLAARQALAIPSAAAPVRHQADELLHRLPGRPEQDLAAVLDSEPPPQWPTVLREELLRWVELPATDRSALVGGFLDHVLDRPDGSYDLAEAYLAVLVELPPRPYGLLVDAVVAACAARPDAAAERMRAVLGSALARFALPQWQRLAAALNAAAQAAGQPAQWR